MNANLTLKGRSCDAFVKSVLRQIASSQKQDIFFESKLPADLIVTQTGDNELFDAIAPNGFDDIDGPVVFEFKSSQQTIKYDKLQSTLNSLYKRVMQLTFSDVTVILLINSAIDPSVNIENNISQKIPYKNQVELKIWDQNKINEWINLYPIDFSNAQNLDSLSKTKETGVTITESDFTTKSKNNLAAIKSVIEKADNSLLFQFFCKIHK